jgi:hypothetical protein
MVLSKKGDDEPMGDKKPKKGKKSKTNTKGVKGGSTQITTLEPLTGQKPAK